MASVASTVLGTERDSASAVAVNPAGTEVVVTGRSGGGDPLDDDYVTVAYGVGSGPEPGP